MPKSSDRARELVETNLDELTRHISYEGGEIDYDEYVGAFAAVLQPLLDREAELVGLLRHAESAIHEMRHYRGTPVSMFEKWRRTQERIAAATKEAK